VNMAKFYAALATDGTAPTPEIARIQPARSRVFQLTPTQMEGLRKALAGVVSAGGTAAASQIQGVMLAGKTGTAQSGKRVEGTELNHAWFVGFAPADQPTIVVAVMLEYGGHGGRAAHIASSIISHYLKVTPVAAVETEG
ncbi:MAG: penicillin-binding transpeptidase domain-containing protein, partial [Gemmatimonadaceae bacterium]